MDFDPYMVLNFLYTWISNKIR